MTDAPLLAEGIAEYLAAVRGPRPASLEEGRLAADLGAPRIACPCPEGMTVTSTFVACEGRETALRLYRPAGEGPQPAIVYCHGGGFTTGSIASYEPVAMALADAAQATVVSVHYARLPEATPRAMIEECYDALCWTARMAVPLDLDPDRIAVAGDSAGAFIAALLAILARDRAGPTLACQLLCYGSFDLDATRPAYRAARDPVLVPAIIEAMIATYQACAARDPAPFPPPLHCPDLAGLPPALLLGAEYDPLLEEGRDFAERLRLAGGSVELRVAPAMCHGFLRAVRFSAPARDEMQWLGQAFQSLIAPKRIQ
ncbi:alpha/beta hydrolase [Hephaestia sp. GCM10023244]|uniref:alpha/beta hydrolase n=1 Tax=unclassified Hephaestia TaxID=2631281 RepID=UPI00207709E2|nr:alpha/beta hydrolase fold domain-containing protein [Hephaestia sp. MAHUQ-44]MCM8732284.1 alpha/beta hydrolase [Hephaestia sp. MAHUQ-44]